MAPGRLGGSVSNVVEPLGRFRRAELPPPYVDTVVEPVADDHEEEEGDEEEEESEEEEEEEEVEEEDEDEEEEGEEDEGEEDEDGGDDDRGTARGKSDDRRHSLVVGVTWDPSRGKKKWAAKTQVEGKQLYLGWHATEQAAARAIDAYFKDGVTPAAMRCGGTSQFKGVSFHKGSRTWYASCRGKHLGVHATEEAAAQAYNDYVENGVVPVKQRERTSQFKGVIYRPSSAGNWRVFCKGEIVGYHATEEAAARAYHDHVAGGVDQVNPQGTPRQPPSPRHPPHVRHVNHHRHLTHHTRATSATTATSSTTRAPRHTLLPPHPPHAHHVIHHHHHHRMRHPWFLELKDIRLRRGRC